MDLQILFTRAKTLPVMPAIMQELLSSLDSDLLELPELASKLAKDQVLSANVLKMANSAAFRGQSQLDSIDAAVIRLGLSRVRSLVVAASLSTVNPGQHFNHQQYWEQAMYVALLSQTLAEFCDASPDVAFTCGMLHSIGELMIVSAAPEQAGLIELSMEQGETRVVAQRQVLGLDYSEIGGELAKRWQFAPVIVSAIEQQLNPLGHKPVSPYAVLIRLAIFVHHALVAGVAPNLLVNNLPASLCNQIELQTDGLSDALASVGEKVKESLSGTPA
ncbi:HDOD domain-containing protein [Aliagarivorans taiwanensis]|uniref:HDOD domain-containing protein n=1 Tax=Aliagarivorans taiwanensis TaxID=561966 RepID=UPI000413E3D9|nr:HDOD domain-containing protein [Aliagarivorans taiwanensis]